VNWFWHHIWIQEREPNIPPGNIQKTLNTIYVHKVSDKWKQYWPYQRVLEFACYKKELNLFRSPKSRVFIVFTFMHHFSTSLLVQIHYRVWFIWKQNNSLMVSTKKDRHIIFDRLVYVLLCYFRINCGHLVYLLFVCTYKHKAIFY